MAKTKKKLRVQDCQTDPCQLCERRQSGETCGSCTAGIVISNGNEIQRCDDCSFFESDDDAVAIVGKLLAMLHKEYGQNQIAGATTVGQAIDRLVDKLATMPDLIGIALNAVDELDGRKTKCLDVDAAKAILQRAGVQ